MFSCCTTFFNTASNPLTRRRCETGQGTEVFLPRLFQCYFNADLDGPD